MVNLENNNSNYAGSLNNIGNVYHHKGVYDKALLYYLDS